MEKDQLFLEKNQPFLMLAIFPSNENWLELITTTPRTVNCRENPHLYP